MEQINITEELNRAELTFFILHIAEQLSTDVNYTKDDGCNDLLKLLIKLNLLNR